MRLPSKRFTLRTLLLGTTAIAVALAWTVSNYQAWRTERAAIERLDDLSFWNVSEISQDFLDQLPDDSGFHCGSVPPGVSITHDSTLPNFFAPIERRFGIKIFQRVTHISSYRIYDPGIVRELSSFGRLQTVAFSYSSTPPNHRPPEESEFLGTVKLFASMHTKIDVTWPEDPLPTAATEQAIANGDPFGGADPFSGGADQFGSDPFGTVETTEP